MSRKFCFHVMTKEKTGSEAHRKNRTARVSSRRIELLHRLLGPVQTHWHICNPFYTHDLHNRWSLARIVFAVWSFPHLGCRPLF